LSPRLDAFLFPARSTAWIGWLRIGLGIQVIIYSLSLWHDWGNLFAATNDSLVNRELSEAIVSLEPYAGNDVLEAYRVMFENMPTALIFDRTLFVHAGIPRDETLQQRWRDLSSLNEHEIRFQMMWSDPSTASFIPADLQRENARFPFGKQQFRGFMNRIGCTTMVRGHEKIDEGFKAIFADPDISLLNLFSAGGAQNADLPPESSYRKVTPMALLVRWRNGQASASPFAIDWQSFQSPQRNQFMKRPPELEFRYQ